MTANLRSFARSPLRLVVVACVAFLATGCAPSRAWFRPAERVLTETVDGVLGAEYELRDSAGRRGEVRVWCLGAVHEEPPDDVKGRAATTFVDIGIEIENSSADPLQFVAAEAKLRSVDTTKGSFDDLAPQEKDKPVTVAPDAVTRTYVSFALPAGIRPKDLRTFRFRWLITGPKERSYREFTTFVRGRTPYYRRAGWSPYWGFAVGVPVGYYWGLGAHWHWR